MNEVNSFNILKNLYMNEVYSSNTEQCPIELKENGRQITKNEMVLCINKNLINYIDDFMDMSIHDLIDRGFISLENRRDVEFFSDKIQLVVAVFMHDSENIVLLKTKQPSAVYPKSTYTFIQGHVNLIDRSMTLHQTLCANATREMFEEVTLSGVSCFRITKPFSTKPEIVQTNATAINRSHIGIVLEISSTYLVEVSSNEEEKHDAVMIKKDDLFQYFYNLCPWVIQCLSKYKFFKI